MDGEGSFCSRLDRQLVKGADVNC